MKREKMAKILYELNRSYSLAIGDTTHPAWFDVKDDQRKGILAGLDSIATSQVNTPEELHAQWMATRLAQGWIYGETKDYAAMTHPDLVGFNEMPEVSQVKDELFFWVGSILLELDEPTAK